jgi:hypothetical protein
VQSASFHPRTYHIILCDKGDYVKRQAEAVLSRQEAVECY